MILCRSMMVRGIGFALSALLLACQTLPDHPACLPAEPGEATPCRPFRAGIVKLNPELDEIKPLAAQDPGGWAVSDQHLIGAIDHRWLAAFSLSGYQPQWFHELAAPVSAPVSVVGDQVLVGLRNGELRSIDQKTGTLKWSQQLGRFVSRPILAVGTTVIAVNVDQQIFALDLQSGNRIWVFEGGRPVNLVVHGGAAPVVAGNQVFFGTSNGEVLSIELSTGRLLWRHSPRYSEFRFKDVIGQLVVFDQLLLIARYDGKLFALDINSGANRIAWENEYSSITTTAFREGVLYVGLLNGEVLAVNASNGKLQWRSQTGESVASLTTGETTLYAGGTEGRITALGNRDGLLLWHDDLQGAVTHAPVLHDGVLYFATGLKVLYGYKIL